MGSGVSKVAGVHRKWLGHAERGGACPGGAGKAVGHGLGAGRIVSMWDVLGGLGMHVRWVEGPSKRGWVYPD